ncbi:MAG TPA: hypothetical protein VJN43_17700 [Bryobacteraceae bacterium]|nr:hypothetical protein [Bryobacteraceae bacterium]
MGRTSLCNLCERLGRLAAAAILAATVHAQPPLTTIQDTLYKADGTRFNGLLIISWNSFEADNSANIVSQSLTVKVVDGNFHVQLVPTADSNPPTYYTVKYNSDGKVQFEETWVVGAVSTPLRIRDVRASVSSPSPVQPPAQTPIQETDVVGLSGDLGLRPVKGSGFSAGRAAVINSNGGLDAVIGNPSDCVLVDGSTGPCGGNGPAFADGEVLGGTVDGTNATFTLANPPNPATSLVLFRNGIAQKPAVDFTLTGSTVQFLAGAIPQPGDTLLAWYRMPGAGGLAAGGLTAPGPEIECSAAGTATSSTNFTSLGSCTIPANVLQTGDRVEIHFDLAHQGTTAGFEFRVLWGGTVITDRAAAASDALIAGKGESAVYSGGAQLRAESWGTALAYAASVANATDNIVPPMKIDFLAKMASTTTETVTLQNFTVVRYPAQ